jgi:hypothetical protein
VSHRLGVPERIPDFNPNEIGERCGHHSSDKDGKRNRGENIDESYNQRLERKNGAVV